MKCDLKLKQNSCNKSTLNTCMRLQGVAKMLMTNLCLHQQG